ncbi:GIY-YIG nuclease family protein [Geminocystis sp. GBBB08]|uniref:GIY-YIG nuclease family protein n=1 Tax=Geminocystis sp. GBBB08 TaxID=2604140 RepID=UPI0027E2CA4D|nr:GIY-YIG nuclease family protein [Geminocystis sp. GBBB08]MBL1208275.1 GIY-YIG nuclease family protein [Geminocystis sp. GBBB08]
MAIYLISDGEKYKIGISKHPDKRLKQLQTGHPQTLKLIKTFDYQIKGKITEKMIEKRIHYLLRQCRTNYNGEWFYFSDYQCLIEIIDQILTHS